MQARDVMQAQVVTVDPRTEVPEVASRLLASRISAAPVVDAEGRLVGIVSEGDLMRRPESGTGHHRSWWLSLLASPEESALAYVKEHGARAEDVMTRDPVTVDEDASLEAIAEILERRRIKRVPVVRDGRVVGIVSRADLLHGLVARASEPAPSASDRALRSSVEAELAEAGVRTALLSVVVSGGIVHMWGAVESEAEKRAARLAAESVPGVQGVREETAVLPLVARSFMNAV